MIDLPLLAKINPPRLSRVLPRERLFTALDAARCHPVVWITAQPGAGKTTLVNSYLESRQLDRLWYQVDAADADAATFFHYLGLAVEQATPGQHSAMPRLTPEYLGGLRRFAQRYFEQAYSRISPHAVLVLDNYQDAGETCFIHDFIAEGLERIPAGINVIIVSRSPPPPAMARLQLNGLLALLDDATLRLTLEESQGFAELHASDVTPDVLDRLHASVHGWAAGLVLMLEQIRRSPDMTAWPSDSTHAVLFDYFAGEILA